MKLTCDFRYMQIEADIKVLTVLQELVRAVNNLQERVDTLETNIENLTTSDTDNE